MAGTGWRGAERGSCNGLRTKRICRESIRTRRAVGRGWTAGGVLLATWRGFLSDLNDEVKIRRTSASLTTASHRPKKRGLCVGKPKRGKGTKPMVLVEGASTPLRAHLDSASPAEVRLLEATLATVKVGRSRRAANQKPVPMLTLRKRVCFVDHSWYNRAENGDSEETVPRPNTGRATGTCRAAAGAESPS